LPSREREIREGVAGVPASPGATLAIARFTAKMFFAEHTELAVPIKLRRRDSRSGNIE
jgi:hypothetical protein